MDLEPILRELMMAVEEAYPSWVTQRPKRLNAAVRAALFALEKPRPSPLINSTDYPSIYKAIRETNPHIAAEE